MKSAKIQVKPGISTATSNVNSQVTSNSASGARTQLHSIIASKSPSSTSLPEIEKTTVTGFPSGTEAVATEQNNNELVEQEEEYLEEGYGGEDGEEDKSKKVVKKLTEEEVLTRVEEVVPKLLSWTDDYSTKECVKDILFLRKYSVTSATNQRRVRYFDKLCELGITTLFEKIWKTNFTDAFPDDIEEDLWKCMRGILLVMWNGTDRSTKLSQSVLDNTTYFSVISWLTHPNIMPDRTNGNTVKKQYAIKGLFGIIHNTLRNCDARPVYRDAGLIDVMKPFLEAPYLIVSHFGYSLLIEAQNVQKISAAYFEFRPLNLPSKSVSD